MKKPWMRDDEVEILEELFMRIDTYFLMEIGAGGSTIYFPQKLRVRKNTQFGTWLALERDEEWYRKVSKWKDQEKIDNIRLEKVDYSYTQKVKDVLDKRDMDPNAILVDGGNRQELLRTINEGLGDTYTLVILHDSGRTQYAKAMRNFDVVRQLTKGDTPDGDGGYKKNGLSVMWNGDREGLSEFYGEGEC